VHFVNKGRNDHNVLPSEGDTWGVQQAQFFPDAEYSYEFDQPGTYPYYCSIHGTATGVGMVGTIEVTAS
jgi:plastocyanin